MWEHVKSSGVRALVIASSNPLLFCAGVAVGFDDAWRWLAFALLALVLHRKAAFEERALAARFPDYAAYAQRTPALIPWLRWP